MSVQSVSVGERLLRPGNNRYEQDRRVWNAMVDHRPAAILPCHAADDVVTGLAYARDRGLPVGVRCGGHGVSGLAAPEGALVLDLRPMGQVRVDPVRRTARVQGGAPLRALDVATEPHGLATTAGNVSHTGVGGLTLGGGMGWLARRHGLSCDNVISFQVVLASGEVVRASPDENLELYWGLRGGGGNFGVVTEFEFRVHPCAGEALIVELDFPAAEALEPMRRWRELCPAAPRDATHTAVLADGVVTLGFVWVGDLPTGFEYASALSLLGRPTDRRIRTSSYLQLQQQDDDVQGHAVRRYFKGHYFRELPDAALEVFLTPGALVRASLQARGGAIAEVPEDATAVSHRDTAFDYVVSTGWTDPAVDARRISAAREAAAGLDAFASGVYVNVLSDGGAQGLPRAYRPEKLTRLAALKAAVDPTNVFRNNQNIAPAADPKAR